MSGECPWCLITLETINPWHMGGGCVGNVYYQFPHPFTPEWCDPIWRQKWLADMDDEELEAMSTEDLAEKLVAFGVATGEAEPVKIFGQYAVALRDIVHALEQSNMKRLPVKGSISFKLFSAYIKGLERLTILKENHE